MTIVAPDIEIHAVEDECANGKPLHIVFLKTTIDTIPNQETLEG